MVEVEHGCYSLWAGRGRRAGFITLALWVAFPDRSTERETPGDGSPGASLKQA